MTKLKSSRDSDQKSPDVRDLTLPLNRCNLPAHIIASPNYQTAPIPLKLDGVSPFYSDLFDRLKLEKKAKGRAQCFMDYMAVRFRLPGNDLTPWPEADTIPRPQANYRKLILGWMFDSDSDAGAAWRWWVESRFGLRTLYHKVPICDQDGVTYHQFMQACARGIYNTNDLACQLDLLYSYCQYELKCRHKNKTHLTLFRGENGKPIYPMTDEKLVCLNNLSSFTDQEDEAFRFGSKIFSVQVPLTKIVCFDSLLPGALGGEAEFMVLGGCYANVMRVY